MLITILLLVSPMKNSPVDFLCPLNIFNGAITSLAKLNSSTERQIFCRVWLTCKHLQSLSGAFAEKHDSTTRGFR